MKTIIGGVNYGHDSDSIASMGGAIAGALNGKSSMPEDLMNELDAVNKRSFQDLSKTVYETAMTIIKNDKAYFEKRIKRIGF